MTKKTGLISVDDYIASQPEGARRALELVRTAVRAALPAADEMISYRIPTYKVRDAPVIYFAGWKEHYSIYPASQRLIAAFRKELKPYTINKNTIRFPLSQPVPEKLIVRLARFRAREVTARSK